MCRYNIGYRCVVIYIHYCLVDLYMYIQEETMLGWEGRSASPHSKSSHTGDSQDWRLKQMIHHDQVSFCTVTKPGRLSSSRVNAYPSLCDLLAPPPGNSAIVH
ncbi:hypothetical protein VTH06DRAFT_1358 [Thermothelomyces fergusii]